MRLVADCFGAPNGLVFSHDERRLFVSDTRAGRIRVFDVHEDGTLSDGEVFAEAGAREKARFDNLRLDDAGRLWAAAMDDGVHCYDPDGTLIGRLDVPESVANISWGGAKRNRLFIAAETSLYSVPAVAGFGGPVSFRSMRCDCRAPPLVRVASGEGHLAAPSMVQVRPLPAKPCCTGRPTAGAVPAPVPHGCHAVLSEDHV